MNYDIDYLDLAALYQTRGFLKSRWPGMATGSLENTYSHIEKIELGCKNCNKKTIASHTPPSKPPFNNIDTILSGEMIKDLELDTKNAKENDSGISHLHGLLPALGNTLRNIEPRTRRAIEEHVETLIRNNNLT